MARAEERLAALEARIAALEAGAVPRLADGTEDPNDPEVFWALGGLRSRVRAPGAVMIVGDVTLPGHEIGAAWQEGASLGDLLDDEWDLAAELLDALAHPVRLRLLRLVLRGAGTARELGEAEGMGTSGQVYHHLRQLVSAGWLRNKGSRYEVPAERVVPLLTTIVGARR